MNYSSNEYPAYTHAQNKKTVADTVGMSRNIDGFP